MLADDCGCVHSQKLLPRASQYSQFAAAEGSSQAPKHHRRASTALYQATHIALPVCARGAGGVLTYGKSELQLSRSVLTAGLLR